MAGRPLEKSAGARMASATLSHRASFGRTKEGRRQALVCAQLTGFDLINPKHLLNGYKLKAVSILYMIRLKFYHQSTFFKALSKVCTFSERLL